MLMISSKSINTLHQTAAAVFGTNKVEAIKIYDTNDQYQFTCFLRAKTDNSFYIDFDAPSLSCFPGNVISECSAQYSKEFVKVDTSPENSRLSDIVSTCPDAEYLKGGINISSCESTDAFVDEVIKAITESLIHYNRYKSYLKKSILEVMRNTDPVSL